VKRVLWFVLCLFVLGELVAFLWWVLPADVHVVAFLIGCFGVLFLGASFLAPDTVRGVVGPPDVPFEGSPSLSVERQPTTPEPGWAMADAGARDAWHGEDAASLRTQLHEEDE
jgi:hypothetical protein